MKYFEKFFTSYKDKKIVKGTKMNKTIFKTLTWLFSFFFLFNCSLHKETKIIYKEKIIKDTLYIEKTTSPKEKRENNVIDSVHTLSVMDSLLRKNKISESKVSLQLYDIKNDKDLISFNDNQFFHPASLNKLFTVFWGLEFLKPSFRIRTVIDYNNKTLYVKGYGDGSLTYEKFSYSLRKYLWENDIKTIDKIVIDDSFFDKPIYGKGWMWDDGPFYYNSPFSAVNINHNGIIAWIDIKNKCINRVDFYPRMDIKYDIVRENLKYKGLRIYRDWMYDKDDLKIVLSGNLPYEKKVYSFRTISDPKRLMLNIIIQILKEEDIRFSGNYSLDELYEEPENPENVYSEPLFYYLSETNKNSDNLKAETVHKIIGAEIFKSFSEKERIKYMYDPFNGYDYTDISIDSMISFLKKEHVIGDKIKIVDGSGSSRYNLIQSNDIENLLKYIYSKFRYRFEFISTLPIGKEDGTLTSRLKETDEVFVIRAKTGSLSNNSGIAGYIENTENGNIYVFVIQIKDFLNSGFNAKKFEDALLREIINSLKNL